MTFSGSSNLKEENERLKQCVADMELQNKKLQAQFDAALALSNKSKDLELEKIQLIKQMRDISDKNEELERRLSIVHTKNEELVKKLENETVMRESLNNAAVAEANKQMQDDKRYYEEEIDKLKSIIKKKDESLNNFDKVINSYQNQMDQIYTAVSSVYNQNISDFDVLMRTLLLPEPEKNKESEISFAQLQDAETKVAFWKKKYKIVKEGAKNKICDHEQIESELMQKIQSLKSEYEKRIESNRREYQNQLADMENELKRTKKEYEIANSKIDELHKELSSEKTSLKLEIQNIKTEQLVQLEQYTLKEQDLQKKLSLEQESKKTFSQQVYSLTKKQMKASNDIKDLETELKSSENKVVTLERELVHAQDTIKALERDKSDMSSQIKMLNNGINDAKMAKERLANQVNKLKLEVESLNAKIEHSQHAYRQAKEETLLVENERDGIIQKMREFQQQSDQLKSKLDEANHSIAMLKSNNNILQTKLNVEAREHENNVLPYGSFLYPELPSDLSDIISDLANNRSLQLSAKIKQIMLVITRWFNSRIDSYEGELKNLRVIQNKYEAIQDETYKFLKYFFPNFSFDFSSLTDEDLARRKFSDIFTQHKNEIEKIKKNAEKSENSLASLYSIMESETIEEAKRFVDNLYKLIENQKGKILKLIKSKRELKKSILLMNSDHEKKIESYNMKVLDLNNQVQKLNEANEALQRDYETQSQKLTEVRNHYTRKIKEMSDLHDGRIGEYDRVSSDAIVKLKQEKNKRHEVEDELAQVKEELDKSLKTQTMLQKHKTKLLAELSNVRNESHEKQSDLVERSATERKLVEDKYEKILQQLKLQNTDLNEALKGITERANQLEVSRDEEKTRNTELQIQLQKYELHVSSLQSELERQKRLFDSQLKSKTNQLENEYSNHLEDLKSQNINEKRNIMTQVAMTFCALFDAHDALDESCFDIFLSNVKVKMTELMSLEAKLRNLLQLSQNQSIIDAVSMLLIKK